MNLIAKKKPAAERCCEDIRIHFTDEGLSHRRRKICDTAHLPTDVMY